MLRFEYIDPDRVIATEDFAFVEAFLRRTGRTEIGWHYITDLAWIYSSVKVCPRELKVLDAGGGNGPVQYLLAELGFDVTNVDLFHSAPPMQCRRRYDMHFEALPSYSATDYVSHLASLETRSSLRALLDDNALGRCVGAMLSVPYNLRHERWRDAAQLSGPVGKIRWLKGNLCAMPELEMGGFGLVVSLSALEHIPLDMLPSAVSEIRRVLAPQANWAVTTSGSASPQTWFHEPSKGHCFSKDDLGTYFDSIGEGDPAACLEKYRSNEYLRTHLADFYRNSGNNGMPWGAWNPVYVPVGIWRS